MVREGDKVYVLSRSAGDPLFQFVGMHEASDLPTAANGISLISTASGPGRTNVVWKRLRVSAESLLKEAPTGPSACIFTMNADGSDLKQVTQPYKDYGNHGSPEWSPDGEWIACDTYKGSTVNSHILLFRADGSDFQDLGIGVMPNFTPDGKRIVFSTTQQGMMIMDIDGTNREVLSSSGWSIVLAPDGKRAGYYESQIVGGVRAANMTVLDMATRRSKPMLVGEHATHFRQIYWNGDWLHNSQEICFQGINRQTGEKELVIVNADGSD